MLSAPLPTSAYFWDRPCVGPNNVCAESSSAQGITGPAAVEDCSVPTQWWFWLLAGGLALAQTMKKGKR